MDEIDLAQEAQARLNKRAIEAHKKIVGDRINAGQPETLACIDCEELIPKARRDKMPGCVRCVKCQSIFEEKR